MADMRGEGIPEVVSYFRVSERIGAGGMGVVYKGYDRRTDTPVAIKFLHAHLADDQSFRERFEREAHVASLLTSPYTVRLEEAGETGGRFYIVMEYVEGHTLKDALKSGPLPLSSALRIALQVSRALEAAGTQNIVHRDIKPENIFVSGDDSVKVGDFGIARQEGSASLTVTGVFIGTLTYAAPEQMLGKADHRSDIYALGVTLYHMLAGQPPFSGTVQELLRLVPDAPPPREPLAEQPAEVVEIVVRCLAKDPGERYQTAAELSADIERASHALAASATEAETVVDEPAKETAAATVLEKTVPIAPSRRPSVSMTLGPPRTGSLMARLGSTRYDLTITNDGDAPAVLELAATDEAGSCRFSLPRRVSVAPGSATTLPMGVRPAKRRWQGDHQTHRFTVSASGAGDGPPTSISGDFSDMSYGWLPFGSALSLGGVAAAIAAVMFLGGDGNGGDGATSTPTLPTNTPDVGEGPPEIVGDEITTESGLVYIDFAPGTGDVAQTGDTVAVDYTGWLQETGELFDSSIGFGSPFTVTIGAGGVIEGWEQGLPGLAEGGARRLIIPPELAYGEAGFGDIIPPNATLVFDIILVEILTRAPETSRIAFTSDRFVDFDIFVMNPDGSDVTALTFDSALDANPAWSPDRTRIAFHSHRDDDLGETGDIFVWNADGSGLVNLTNNPGVDDDSPTWSPDGTRIAFFSNRSGNFDIFVMNADGSGVVNLTDDPADEFDPAWSPDGSRIAFASDRFVDFDIFVMNPDGSGVVSLTDDPADDFDPAWSPDGTRIAFHTFRDGDAEIYVVNVNGSGLMNLTNDPADDFSPAWSPDGTRIAFDSFRDGNTEIYVMNSDGSEQTNITNNPAEDELASW